MIKAYSEINQDIFSYSLVDGDYPKNQNEIMIEAVAESYLDKQYNIGDSIALNTGQKEETYKIVGFFRTENSSKRNIKFSAVTIKDKACEGSTWNVYVNFKEHNDIKTVSEKISSDLGVSIFGYNEEFLSLYWQDINADANRTLLVTCCALLIVVSKIIIRNTIHMSVVERTKDFGILRCLGSSQKKLKK